MATRDPQPASPAPSVFDALKEAGLKLVPGKAQVEVLIVDHLEQPTENRKFCGEELRQYRHRGGALVI